MPRYYIETYGCAANQADSLIMKGILDSNGWVESGESEANVIVINTCGVKRPTEDKILYRIREVASSRRPLVVAGCLTRIDRKAILESGCSVAIDVTSVEMIAEAAKMAMDGASGRLLTSGERADKPALIRRKLTPTIGVIEIQEGCNYSCSFCATKFSRGNAYSFPAEGIIRAASGLVRQGAIEIQLTGQDVASYYYRGKRLPDLLEEMASIEAEFKVRVGMMTPQFARAIIQGLLGLFPSERIYQFFHVPVQSGSDRVLHDMKRGYRASMFEGIAGKIREKLPMSTIETDIIVGYPTETEADFQETLSLLERVRPSSVNLSKFWPMPGTEASRLKPIDSRVVARRSRQAYELILELLERANEAWLGWEGEAIITEAGSKPGTWKGRNFAYKQVVVSSGESLLGRKVNVKVESVDSVNLYARLKQFP